MPCANTIAGLLRRLDPDRLDQIIGAWLADRHPDGWEHLALDGKRLCGSREDEVPGTHLLAAYAPTGGDGVSVDQVIGSPTVRTALEGLGLEPGTGTVADTARAGEVHSLRDKVG